MAGQIFALVVGIQRYAEVPNLHGPERDMRYIFGMLQKKYQVPRNNIIPLLDSGATYQGITDSFEKLVDMVGPGDTALFYFSGHGGRVKSASEFEHLSGDGYDETLICFDSRSGNVPELADKELAWYFSRLTDKEAQTVSILDCCHAGGMTRNGGKGAVKQVDPIDIPRPIESYRGNWVTGKANDLPSRSVLAMSACNRFQLAREYGSEDKGVENLNRGVFTLALEGVLAKNDQFSYPELFAQTRLETLEYNLSQTPQMDLIGGFDPYCDFLTHQKTEPTSFFQLSYEIAGENGEAAGWKLNLGAAGGLSPDMASRPDTGEITILDDSGSPLSKGSIQSVGLNSSSIEIEKTSLLDKGNSYPTNVQGIPIDPLVIPVHGFKNAVDALMDVWKTNSYPLVYLAPGNQMAKYSLKALDGSWQLWHQSRKEKLLEAPLDQLIASLKQVADWEGLANVNSPNGLEAGILQYHIQINPLASERAFKGSKDIVATTAPGKPFQRYRLFFQNESSNKLHWYLLLLTDGFGIIPMEQDILPKRSDWALVHKVNLGLKDDAYSTSDRMKLICSVNPIDVFRLVREPLPATRGRLGKDPGKLVLREWNAENFDFHTYRSLGMIGPRDLNLASERLVFPGHSSFRAEVSLWSSAPQIVSPGSDPAPTEFLKEAGIAPVSFLAGSVWHYQLIGLKNIEGSDDLLHDPLILKLPASKSEDSGDAMDHNATSKNIWPLAWNGKHLWIAGKPIGDGKVALTNVHPQTSPIVSEGDLEIRFCLFEISDQNVNLEGLEGSELATELQKLN